MWSLKRTALLSLYCLVCWYFQIGEYSAKLGPADKKTDYSIHLVIISLPVTMVCTDP